MILEESFAFLLLCLQELWACGVGEHSPQGQGVEEGTKDSVQVMGGFREEGTEELGFER